MALMQLSLAVMRLQRIGSDAGPRGKVEVEGDQ